MIIRDYLFNRSQYTVIADASSSRRAITYGVPQGSILGPLLFLIYINDLHFSFSFFSFLLFADDTTIIYSNTSQHSLVRTLNTELTNISLWFQANKLSLNSNKTKCIFFTKSEPKAITPSIYINNSPISQVHSINFWSYTQ